MYYNLKTREENNMSKSKRGGGKTFRQELVKGGRERNWSELETKAFCTILADAEFQFSVTLESKAQTERSFRKFRAI